MSLDLLVLEDFNEDSVAFERMVTADLDSADDLLDFVELGCFAGLVFVVDRDVTFTPLRCISSRCSRAAFTSSTLGASEPKWVSAVLSALRYAWIDSSTSPRCSSATPTLYKAVTRSSNWA